MQIDLYNRFMKKALKITKYFSLFSLLFLIIISLYGSNNQKVHAANADNWSTFMYNSNRSGANMNEGKITTSNVSSLVQNWSVHLNSEIATEPIMADGLLFQGDWNGDLVAIDPQSGKKVWSINLPAENYNCGGGSQNRVGIVGSPTIVDKIIYVSSGSTVYAIDETGVIKWKYSYIDADGSMGVAFIWGSPLYHAASIFVGIASQCDGFQRPIGGGNLIVPNGNLLQLNALTGSFQNIFSTVKGRNNVTQTANTGGGIWSTPALSSDGNTIFVAVGNAGDGTSSSQLPQNAGLAESIIGIDAATLQLKGYFKPSLPGSTATYADADFGTTPVVFSCGTDTYVSANSKDGNVYTLNTSKTDPATGMYTKAWSRKIARADDDPFLGGSIATSVYENGMLFVAGGPTDSGVKGSVTALDACSGKILWSDTLSGITLAPLSYANGILLDATGNMVELRNSINGNVLFSTSMSSSPAYVHQSGSILVNGMLLTASSSGILTSFTLPASTSGTPTPTPSRTTPTITPTPASVSIGNLQVLDTQNKSNWSIQSKSLQPGSILFADRGYAVTSIAPQQNALSGMQWIKTANNSKYFTGNPVATFTVSKNATIYVGIDSRASTPAWMNGWTNSGITVKIDDASQANFILYQKLVPAGTVTVGPNTQIGPNVNMYTLFVK